MNKTKKTIFDSAMKVFSQRGYTGATMDEIAVTAGVAKGTLYYHFKSKEEIFKYIITEGMNLIKEQVEIANSEVEDPIEKLRGICRVQLSVLHQNKDFFKVVMSQLWGQELRQLQLRDVIRAYIQGIEKYLGEAMNAGVIKKGETSFMAYTFFGTLCSAAVYELMNEEKKDIESIIDNLMRYILNGIIG
ncbi:MAG: TetR/AcrR family transcriptional regulator [Bacillota bacterium]|nr:TetR/AcrR family transcriptional regulator [Bacillota bacterium]